MENMYFFNGIVEKQMGDSDFDYETRIGASGSYMDDSGNR